MGARPDLWDGELDTLGRIRRAGCVQGLNAIDLNYPQHIKGYTPAQIRSALDEAGLSICAINLRYDGLFANGGFTNPDPRLRQKAIDVTRQVGLNHSNV